VFVLKLAFIIVVLGLVSVGAARVVPGLLRPAPEPTPPVAATPTVDGRPMAVNGPFERRVLLFAQSLQEGRPASLQVAEAEATAVARTALERRGEDRVRDLAVRFANGRVEAHATMSTPVGAVPMVAVLTPAVASDGTIDVRVESVRVAGTAPPFVEQMARAFIEDQLARRMSQPEWMVVQHVEVADGQLRLDALPRTR
jgi:hypothetical protein